MEDNVGIYYIADGMLKSSADPVENGDTAGRAVYEVIRVIDGVPLFFEDHYIRMCDSIRSLGGHTGIGDQELKGYIETLIRENGNPNCNVRVTVSDVTGAGRLLLYISKSYYPGAEAVAKGVPTGLVLLERPDPNVKQVNKAYKQTVAEKMQAGGFFEVLLVNSQGYITEGSKSNVFFVKGQTICTAPGDQVLKGITRKYVLDACRSTGYEVVEEMIAATELGKIDGVFLSGTSIKVLPVSSIDGLAFSSAMHPVIQAVREEYDRLLTRYLRGHKK